MTRRLVLVNLSNWDGEDYEVKVEGQRAIKTLAPGHCIELENVHSDVGLVATPVEREGGTNPFLSEDKLLQYLPEMHLYMDVANKGPGPCPRGEKGAPGVQTMGTVMEDVLERAFKEALLQLVENGLLRLPAGPPGPTGEMGPPGPVGPMGHNFGE